MQVIIPDTIYSGGALLSGKALWIDADRVSRVDEASRAPADARRMPGRALLPGFCNAHSHAFQRGLRGRVQYSVGGDSFWTWRDTMYRLANALDPDGVEAVSALAFLEMVRAGYTTVGEFHYLHHQPDGTAYADPDELAWRVAAAAEAVGIRLVLLRVAYARSGYGAAPNQLQRRFIDASPDAVLSSLGRLSARGLRVGLAPHSIRACPRDWLRALRAFDGPIHAHVDEQPGEIASSLAEYSARPLTVFAEEGLVDSRFTAVHFTHAADDERRLLLEQSALVCVCPSTELDLGDGFFPASAHASGRLCIGSDSQVLIDPIAEIRAIEWHGRALANRRNVVQPQNQVSASAARLWEIGSRGGAEALGLVRPGELEGGLVPGALADFIAVDTSRPEQVGGELLPSLVYSGAAVTDVWVGGRQVVVDGDHTATEAILARARRVLAV